MYPAEDLREWAGKNVVDPSGATIGTLEAVYFDTAADVPTFVTVKTGIIGRHRLVFVPLAGATVSPKHLRVQADKKTAKDAPGIDTDGELTAEEEPGVFEYWGLEHIPGSHGERRLGRR